MRKSAKKAAAACRPAGKQPLAQGAGDGAHVLYVSSFLAQATYDRLLRDAPYPPSQATQKYNALLTAGLVHAGAQVTALSAPPLSCRTCGRRFVRLKRERSEGVSFCYLPVVNLPVLKQLVTWICAFFSTLRHLRPGTHVLCYGLIVSACGGARAAARLKGCPAGVIVSDMPEELGGGRAMRLAARELTRYDGYVLLTEAMNGRVNPHGRPFLVVEGQADANLAARENALRDKHLERVCLYAGMLHARYGILRLVEAFLRMDAADARLVIYGTGDARAAIEAAAKKDARIQYRGVKDNANVVAEELRATLLVNPRPSDEAFTRFSFPSKNLEYMASGTPVLTTRLPGMPPEYRDYVYLFEGETPEAMAQTLTEVLKLPREELHEKGLAAKAFVLAQKSNNAQARRILDFMGTLALRPRGDRPCNPA